MGNPEYLPDGVWNTLIQTTQGSEFTDGTWPAVSKEWTFAALNAGIGNGLMRESHGIAFKTFLVFGDISSPGSMVVGRKIGSSGAETAIDMKQATMISNVTYSSWKMFTAHRNK